MENTLKRTPWSDSDRALAFVMFQSTLTATPLRFNDKEFQLIASSRANIRSAGSWSKKLANYSGAHKYLTGITAEPIYDGNSSKEEFPGLLKRWNTNRQEVIDEATTETFTTDENAISLYKQIGIIPKIGDVSSFKNKQGGENPSPSMATIDNRLITSLGSKPFIILAGGTGTGKTRSARQLAIQIAGEENVETVAVGSDWTDSRPLLGFRNLLSNDGKSYVVPAALKLILKANKNLRDAENSSEMINDYPGNSKNKIEPHFLILDEMNLSHVERYFADFLSSMESHEPLRLHDYIEGLKYDGTNEIVPHQVACPKNLFIIGTVNIDETTYMFSPKVLDRAHVIEFKVPWDEIKAGLSSPPARSLPRWELSKTKAFMNIALDKDKSLESQVQERLLMILEDLYKCLEGTRFNFAHRTARECLNYIATSIELSDAKLTPAEDLITLIDLAILQKALPKINGSTGSLSIALEALVQFSAKHKLTNCETKLKKMSEQLKNDQFVSFIQ